MFVGQYEYKVDNKGRLPLPPKFRKEMDDGLVLTMVADNCITAYTKADWAKMTANAAPTGFLVSDNTRKLNRFIYSNANEVSIDNQGRIALPSTLREKCGISDTAVIAGINNCFEIWTPSTWNKEQLSTDEARQLMDKLEERK
ncbi:MAG: division/cell wall cluster transcriptional repressor MraZ [Dehalococcoidia bacterium]|nr:division/cell wall cluster transcriptional repressor MraZ [Dehalococcoidia bacterium]